MPLGFVTPLVITPWQYLPLIVQTPINRFLESEKDNKSDEISLNFSEFKRANQFDKSSDIVRRQNDLKKISNSYKQLLVSSF